MNLLDPSFIGAEADRRADPARASQDERDFDVGFDAREQKRLRRLSHLSDLGMAGAEECARVLIGKSPACDPGFFAGGNLEGAFNRTARTVRQTTALEDKIDQERKARLMRTAEEEMEHRDRLLADKARREAARTEAVANQAFERRKKAIRGAVELAHEDVVPQMDPMERENLLDDLFVDYNDYKDWGEDDAVIVYKTLSRMGLLSQPREKGQPAEAPANAPEYPDDRSSRPKVRAIAMARHYLDRVAGECADAANDPGAAAEAGLDPPVANTS